MFSDASGRGGGVLISALKPDRAIKLQSAPASSRSSAQLAAGARKGLQREGKVGVVWDGSSFGDVEISHDVVG